jgi:stress response protein YsnF
VPAVRVEGATTIIPVIEEQLVVEKRLVLVEEIHIIRRSETQVEQVPVTLRSERAEIEREEAGA